MGIPQLQLMHYLATTPYGRRPVVWGNRLRDARHPRRLVRVARARMLSLRGPRGAPPTRRVVDRVRAELGLPAAGPEAFVGARDSIVAITTAPFLDPGRGLPLNWRYVGPIAWSPPAPPGVALPERGERPLVYVTQGSTGDPDLLRWVVGGLADAELELLVTTGG